MTMLELGIDSTGHPMEHSRDKWRYRDSVKCVVPFDSEVFMIAASGALE
jgi:hypothetical protein